LLVPTHSQEYRLAMCLRTTVARTNIAWIICREWDTNSQ
jgi:hypothetical protein